MANSAIARPDAASMSVEGSGITETFMSVNVYGPPPGLAEPMLGTRKPNMLNDASPVPSDVPTVEPSSKVCVWVSYNPDESTHPLTPSFARVNLSVTFSKLDCPVDGCGPTGDAPMSV